MQKLDLWLLNALDAQTIKLQRKGYRLTELYVHVAGANFVANLADAWPRPFWSGFCCLVCGSWFIGSVVWANQNRDYPESVKIMECLNAKALEYRETDLRWRKAFLLMMMVFGLTDIIRVFLGDFTAIVSFIAVACPALMFYLHGCFYIGPGHFAKERKEQLQGNEILDR